MNKEKNQMIRELRSSGFTRQEIAARVGIGFNALRAVLEKERLTRRRATRTEEQKQNIIRLACKGKNSPAQIAKQLNLGLTTVKRILRIAGVTEEQRTTILQLFHRGYSKLNIMREVNVEADAVVAVISRAGHSFAARDTINVSQEQKAEILKCFDKGHSGPHIREKFGISESILKILLRQNGKSFQERHRQLSQRRRDAVLKLRAEGLSWDGIAKEVKTGTWTIWQILKNADQDTSDESSQSTAFSGPDLNSPHEEQAIQARQVNEFGCGDIVQGCQKSKRESHGLVQRSITQPLGDTDDDCRGAVPKRRRSARLLAKRLRPTDCNREARDYFGSSADCYGPSAELHEEESTGIMLLVAHGVEKEVSNRHSGKSQSVAAANSRQTNTADAQRSLSPEIEVRNFSPHYNVVDSEASTVPAITSTPSTLPNHRVMKLREIVTEWISNHYQDLQCVVVKLCEQTCTKAVA
ncbi:uncharacterized protein LOC129600026 [Paramacrobiotus metropolitanus]|uniref:uncharacterized protein LOC129600026 n=1 Tax=Paramacrobiotus metropolitanus TaxID=2943436 RepID=UPI002445626E|nr:uncharacterized protein LOC129600026 [Paramacrobiotus metropolitanus]XP_055354385.1 uncharacterized protein LOC129600026 [Paramacrobiotus metropolitanus]